VARNTGVTPRERRSEEIEIERRSSATSKALTDTDADADADTDADADAEADADVDADVDAVATDVDWRALADWRLAERSPAVEREAQAALNLARSDTPLHGVMASRRLYGRPTERVLS
jgi:hypothetical protein